MTVGRKVLSWFSWTAKEWREYRDHRRAVEINHGFPQYPRMGGFALIVGVAIGTVGVVAVALVAGLAFIDPLDWVGAYERYLALRDAP